MDVLKKRGIELIDKVINGRVVNSNNAVDSDIGHITTYSSLQTMYSIVSDIDKALQGNFDLIVDNDISTDAGGLAFIMPYGIEYWDEDGLNILLPLCPLSDFKELLTAWINFIQSPPLEGEIIECNCNYFN